MSTSPGSTFDAMASASLGPDEFDDPELPLPELPEFPKDPPPKGELLPNGEPLPKGLPEEPERPEDPEPEGACELPDVGLKAWVLLSLLFDVA